MIFKTVIKIPGAARAAGLALVLVGAAATVARAETVYHTPRSLLSAFFPGSERVTFQRFPLAQDERDRLARRLGYAPKRPSYVFYIASTAGHIDGYALIDDELGQTEPITFGVKLSPDGTVERTEILIYREPRGDEVRARRFLDQLRGKTVRQPVQAGVDIDAVSGATVSSHAIANGVRRALILYDELIARGARTAHADARLGGR